MSQPTQQQPDAGDAYQPCGKCRRCVSGVPLGSQPSPDDCYSRHLYSATDARGIVEPEATR